MTAVRWSRFAQRSCGVVIGRIVDAGCRVLRSLRMHSSILAILPAIKVVCIGNAVWKMRWRVSSLDRGMSGAVTFSPFQKPSDQPKPCLKQFMSKINSRTKGANGEREVAKILREELGIDVQRNWAEQAARGGADILIPGWAIEVKRCKKAMISNWWTQAAIQAQYASRHPLLVYRLDRGKWRAVMSIRHLIPNGCHHQLEMNFDCWCQFYRNWRVENRAES